MPEIIKKSFDNPDELEEYPGVRIATVNIEGIEVKHYTFEAGWRWPEDTESCKVEHLSWLVISGRLAVRMDDGTTVEFGPGDIGRLTPGHIAWVVGDEPVVAIDIEKGGIDQKKVL